MNNYNGTRDGKSGCFFKLLGDNNNVMVEVIAATIIFPDFGETIPNPEMQVCIMEAVMENLGLIEISR